MKNEPFFAGRFRYKGQIKILLVGIFFIISLFISGFLAYQVGSGLAQKLSLQYTPANSLYEIKQGLSFSKGFLTRELNLRANTSNHQPLIASNISQGQLDFKLRLATLRHYAQPFKAALFFTVAFLGLLVLLYVSYREQNLVGPIGKWEVRRWYILALLFSVLIIGFFLGKSPNPMEETVRMFKISCGFHACSFRGLMLIVLFVIVTIIGNKIICGWACPFGSVQELLFILSSRIKKIRLPLIVTNTVRVLIFILFLLVLLGLVGGPGGFAIYHYINPFNIFVPYFKPVILLVAILLFLVASLFVYRPFCRLVCPFGLMSWLLENFSIFKIRVDHDKCVKCKICYKFCPTGAINGKVEGDKIPKECFSCGRCLGKCPQKAIRYD